MKAEDIRDMREMSIVPRTDNEAVLKQFVDEADLYGGIVISAGAFQELASRFDEWQECPTCNK